MRSVLIGRGIFKVIKESLHLHLHLPVATSLAPLRSPLSLALSVSVSATFQTLISVKLACLHVLLMSSFSWTHKKK